MSASRWKILGTLLLIVVVITSVGSYRALNEPLGRTTTNLASTMSLQATTSGTMQTTNSTGLSYPPIQWITIGRIQPISYYLLLLQSCGTLAYVQLAQELQKLPDYSNGTAVAEITYLALNATNPEVKEAFQLMMKGGTPSQGDSKYYVVPAYNTELQALYWIASQRQLKRDDTLALAISMSNGFWITIGNVRVKSQVRKDVVDLLDFFRETDALQEAYGYPALEQLPLEAKIALAWLGGDTGTHGPHAITSSATHHNSLEGQMDLISYEWDNVNITTLQQMRDYMQKERWVTSSIDQTVANLEGHFFVNGNGSFHRSDSWGPILVNGETVPAHNMNNANFNFQYYLRNGYAIGVCDDQMTLVSAFLKSWGIATLPQLSYWFQGNWYNGHSYTMYYDPSSATWKVNPHQIDVVYGFVRDAYVFIPPILQNQWIPVDSIPKEAVVPYPYQTGELNTRMYAPMYNTTGLHLTEFIQGVPTAEIKQWILYNGPSP